MIPKKRVLVFYFPVVALIVLAFTIPNCAHDSRTAPKNACINNLRQIEVAKERWAMDNHKTNGPVTWNDLMPFLAPPGLKAEILHCPERGVYTIGNIEEPPKCSIKGHEFQ
jgi:hypothetical protein